MRRRYEALQEFFLAYFHPDWQLDAGSWSEVVEDFVRTSDPELVDRVEADLLELVAEPTADAELHDAIVREYSLFYDPARDGLTMRAWLESLARELQTIAPS
ncbi:MAG: hypothetical protein QOH29_2119 [Actinomycetota bacterium]|nr:hypothetical protein [Actinomycetota bacterium]